MWPITSANSCCTSFFDQESANSSSAAYMQFLRRRSLMIEPLLSCCSHMALTGEAHDEEAQSSRGASVMEAPRLGLSLHFCDIGCLLAATTCLAMTCHVSRVSVLDEAVPLCTFCHAPVGAAFDLASRSWHPFLARNQPKLFDGVHFPVIVCRHHYSSHWRFLSISKNSDVSTRSSSPVIRTNPETPACAQHLQAAFSDEGSI